MKTAVKFGTTYDAMKEEVTFTLLIAVSENLVSTVDLPDAIKAVTDAFHRADGSAGNGGSSKATATQGVWKAEANIDKGEFSLWRQVL